MKNTMLMVLSILAMVLLVSCSSEKDQEVVPGSSQKEVVQETLQQDVTHNTGIITTVVKEVLVPDTIVRLDLYAEDVKDLAGFQFSIEYNNDVLEFDHVSPGSWVSEDGQMILFSQPDLSNPGVVKNIVGIRLKGLSGSGVLASVYFKTKMKGPLKVTITDLLLSTSKATPMPSASVQPILQTPLVVNDTALADKQIYLLTGIMNTSQQEHTYIDNQELFLQSRNSILGSDGPITIDYTPKAYTGPVNIYLFSDSPVINFSDLEWYHPTQEVVVEKYTCSPPAHYEIQENVVTCFTKRIVDKGVTPPFDLESAGEELLFRKEFDTFDESSSTFFYTVKTNNDWEFLTHDLIQAPTTLTNMKHSYMYQNFLVQEGQEYQFRVHMNIPFSQQRSQGEYYLSIAPSNASSLAILDPWYNNSWSYRKNITINATEVNSSHTDFPVVLVINNDSQLAANALANGDDILFTDINGVKLDHEIEIYNSTIGNLIAWIRFPTLTNASGNTMFSMYYGNPTATDQSNKYGVWNSTYKAVWHLINSTRLNDSTRNGNNGTNHGSTDSTGRIDGAMNFVGASSQYIDTGSGNSLDIPGSLTFSVWMNTSTTSESIFNRYKGSGSFDGYGFDVGTASTNKVSYWSSVKGSWVGGTTSVNDGVLHYVVVTVAGTTANFYIDGVTDGTAVTNIPGTWTVSTSSTIGSYNAGTSSFFTGRIDEMRLTNITHNTSWIMTEYNNQRNSTTFLSVDGQENVPITGFTFFNVTGNIRMTSNGMISFTNNGRLRLFTT